MNKWKIALKKWGLALASTSSLLIGAFALQACAGEGGSVGGSGSSGGSGDPSVVQQFKAILTPAQADAKYVGAEKCGSCHGGTDAGDDIYSHWKDTVHSSKNVTCEQCHGPGGAHVVGPSTDNILTFPKVLSSVVCGQCHGKTYTEWTASPHAQLVNAPIEETITVPAVYKNAQCMVCHSSLARNRVTDEGQNLSAWTDADAAVLAEETITDLPHTSTCATCHNPHSKTGNLTDDGKEVQLRHAVMNTDTSQVAPTTTPDKFTHFDQICAQCHNGRGVDPSDTKLTTSTARPGMHDSNQFNMLMGFGGVEGSGVVQRNMAHATMPGQCTHCHMPDSRHTYTVSFDKGCQPCHTATDAAARAAQVKEENISALYALRTRMTNWAQANLGDPLFWEYTTNIQAAGGTPPNQTLVPIQVKRARHNYYFVVRDGSMGPHNSPYSRHLINVANQNLDALGAPAAPRSTLSVSDKLKAIQGDRTRARNAGLGSAE